MAQGFSKASPIAYISKVKQRKALMPRTEKSDRPEALLSTQDYLQDFKARWAIHVYETKALAEDLQKAYEFMLPFCKKSIDFCIEQYYRFRPQSAS